MRLCIIPIVLCIITFEPQHSGAYLGLEFIYSWGQVLLLAHAWWIARLIPTSHSALIQCTEELTPKIEISLDHGTGDYNCPLVSNGIHTLSLRRVKLGRRIRYS